MTFELHLLRTGKWFIFGTRMQFKPTGEGYPIGKDGVELLRPYCTASVDPLLNVEILEAREVQS